MPIKGVFDTSSWLTRLREEIFQITCEKAESEHKGSISYAQARNLAVEAYKAYQQKIRESASDLSEPMIALALSDQGVKFKTDLIAKIESLSPVRSPDSKASLSTSMATTAQPPKFKLTRWVWQHLKP